MKKTIYISALMLMAVCLFSSCEDFLDADNKSAGGQTAADYFKTEEGLAAFRVNAYYSLQSMSTWTDIYVDGTDLYVPSRGKTPTAFQYQTVTAETGDVKNLFAACFQVINNANGLLFYGGDKYAADAKFLRAYGYYMLTQQFGPVYYSTEYINNANREYPRTDLKTIYDNTIADLQSIVEDTNVPELTHDGTVNRRAAAALLAKVALAAGWDLQTTLDDEEKGTFTKGQDLSYFTVAATAAEIAIQGIALTQSFEEKWSADNEDTNPETFFAVQYDRAGYPGDVNTGGHGLQNDWGSYYGAQDANGLKVSSSVKVPSYKSLFLWGKGDERYAATYMTTFYNYDGKSENWPATGYYAYYSSSNRDALPIALYYAPYYVTKAEFESYLKTNKERFVQGEYKNAPKAYLMAGTVLKYEFNADGSYKSPTSLTYNDQTLANELNFTPCVKKWDDPQTIFSPGNVSNCYRDIVLLHASDIYLVAAEAYYMLGDKTNFWDKLNAVRTRAKAPALNAISDYDVDYSVAPVANEDIQYIDLILDERARELYAENQRWADLRRTRQLIRYNIAYNSYIDGLENMQNARGETRWYRPIPSAEMGSNTAEGLVQNPGY